MDTLELHSKTTAPTIMILPASEFTTVPVSTYALFVNYTVQICRKIITKWSFFRRVFTEKYLRGYYLPEIDALNEWGIVL